MKKFIYIAILCVSSFGFGQGYEAKLVRTGSGNTTFTFTTRATYTAFNGATQVDVFTDNNIASSNEPPTTVYLNSTIPITRITLSYSRTYQEGGANANCFVDQAINVTNTNCYTTVINRCVNFNVEVYNTQDLLIQPTNNTICIDDLLSLSAGNDCFDRTYNWEYTTNITNAFQSLGVQSTGTTPVNADLSTVLGPSYTGNVFIRARVSGRFTNTITYAIISCTPGISSVATAPVSCSQFSDGTFTLTFNETLNNEALFFELRADSPTGPLLQNLTETISGTTFTWPNPLAARTYYLDYQSAPAGSVIQFGPIVIASPTPITFTAGWTDVDCFGENTGSISINAGGGVGNYQYSINNGANWSNFSNATSHSITNLPAGNYQVKVRDGDNCVAQ